MSNTISPKAVLLEGVLSGKVLSQWEPALKGDFGVLAPVLSFSLVSGPWGEWFAWPFTSAMISQSCHRFQVTSLSVVT